MRRSYGELELCFTSDSVTEDTGPASPHVDVPAAPAVPDMEVEEEVLEPPNADDDVATPEEEAAPVVPDPTIAYSEADIADRHCDEVVVEDEVPAAPEPQPIPSGPTSSALVVELALKLPPTKPAIPAADVQTPGGGAIMDEDEVAEEEDEDATDMMPLMEVALLPAVASAVEAELVDADDEHVAEDDADEDVEGALDVDELTEVLLVVVLLIVVLTAVVGPVPAVGGAAAVTAGPLPAPPLLPPPLDDKAAPTFGAGMFCSQIAGKGEKRVVLVFRWPIISRQNLTVLKSYKQRHNKK